MRSHLLIPAALLALLLAVLPWPRGDHAELMGAVEIAPARVESVTRVARGWSIGRLYVVRATPYDVVRLRVAPAEGGDSVLAIDAIDAGGEPALEPGSVEEVFYPEAAPAAARLINANRTYQAQNRLKALAALLSAASAAAALGLGIYGVRQVRMARLGSRAAPAEPARPQ